jgi:putative membrane protein
MILIMWLAAIAAGAVHVLIFCMESLWWTTPQVRHRFRQTEQQAEGTRLLAFNQGYYNLFLAFGIFAGLALAATGHPNLGLVLVLWNCLFMLGAAIVLAASAPGMWRGALIQGTAPLVFLLLFAIHGTAGA